MGLNNIGATIGGVLKSLIVAVDTNGNIASAHTTVDQNGAPIVVALDSSLAALLAAERPYQGVVAMAVGTAQPAQRALRVNCTAAGNVSLTYADGSTDVIPVNVGLSYIAGAITTVNSVGTTATATYANMK